MKEALSCVVSPCCRLKDQEATYKSKVLSIMPLRTLLRRRTARLKYCRSGLWGGMLMVFESLHKDRLFVMHESSFLTPFLLFLLKHESPFPPCRQCQKRSTCRAGSRTSFPNNIVCRGGEGGTFAGCSCRGVWEKVSAGSPMDEKATRGTGENACWVAYGAIWGEGKSACWVVPAGFGVCVCV